MKRKLAEERLSMVAEKRQLPEENRNAQEEIVKTDNGPQLNAAEFNAKYCTANCITHEKVTPRWAQANGEVERQNRSMEKRKNELQKYVTKYRGLHQTTTGKSLAELMLNRYVKGKLPDQGKPTTNTTRGTNKIRKTHSRKCCKGMMTMLQAFKLTLSCQNSRTDH